MKMILLIIIVLHGLLHLLGFTKAFNLPSANQLSQNISKINGMLWLTSAILFIITAILLFLRKDSWWIPSVAAILISQYLIFTSWHDAKFGTIANVIILIVTIIGYSTWSFSNKYENKVKEYLKQTASISDSLLTDTDLLSLPEPLRKYLRYTGTVGKPKVKNFKV